MLIHIYSTGYMAHEGGYYRFFGYLNLFMFSMLTLILANNYVLMFVGWEGVGLCSYLLIGFYFHRKSASDAANKAFIVNRIGDAGFILGMFFIAWLFGSLRFIDVTGFAREHAASLLGNPYHHRGDAAAFVGACGKSAQLPLYVWLPDAMEGPTPVSALIHAATMVAAGVYLVARSNALFVPRQGDDGRGHRRRFTAIFAASMGWCRTTSNACWRSRRSPSSATCSSRLAPELRGRCVPPVHARVLQGAAVPRCGLGDPCYERRAGHARAWVIWRARFPSRTGPCSIGDGGDRWDSRSSPDSFRKDEILWQAWQYKDYGHCALGYRLSPPR